jgi:hypothetical protein
VYGAEVEEVEAEVMRWDVVAGCTLVELHLDLSQSHRRVVVSLCRIGSENDADRLHRQERLLRRGKWRKA